MTNRRLFMQTLYTLLSFIACLLVTPQSFALETYTSIYDQIGPQENYVDKNYNRLVKALAFFEAAAAKPESYPWPTIPETERLLHRGSKNHAVFAVRELLKTMNDLSEEADDSNVYDKEVERAVKLFQWRNGLNSDGVVGPKTRDAMNITPQIRVQQIRADLQRWQALKGQLGDRFVLVNVPEYKLYLYDHDQEVLTMKVIVGKPTWPTPELQSKITQIVFNPRWNVPHRIARNDIIPKLMADPNYLNENHIRVFNNQSDNAYEVNPNRINWERAREGEFSYFFRQDAGGINALGQVKFEFQNTHDIYLHDTPAKTLFTSDLRALSHGCIRLEKPFDLVNYLTQDDSRIDDMKIQDKLDSLKTSYFTVRQPIPIIITYITSWVDDNGIVHFVDDIYHRNDPNYVPSLENATEMEEHPDRNSEKSEDYDKYDPYNSGTEESTSERVVDDHADGL